MALEEELVRSRQVLRERLDVDSRIIAYPYGDRDERVAAAARAAGYTVGVLADRRSPRADPMAIGRLGINDGTSVADIQHFLSAAGECEERWFRQLRVQGTS